MEAELDRSETNVRRQLAKQIGNSRVISALTLEERDVRVGMQRCSTSVDGELGRLTGRRSVGCGTDLINLFTFSRWFSIPPSTASLLSREKAAMSSLNASGLISLKCSAMYVRSEPAREGSAVVFLNGKTRCWF